MAIDTNTSTPKSIKNNTCSVIFAVGLCFAILHVCLPKQHIEHMGFSSNTHTDGYIVNKCKG